MAGNPSIAHNSSFAESACATLTLSIERLSVTAGRKLIFVTIVAHNNLDGLYDVPHQ